MAKKGFGPSQTRTFALVGHRSAGKTSLAEVLIQATGATRGVGSVDDGTALLDHASDARRQHQTLEVTTAWLTWRDHILNLVDTPGAQDLATDVALTLEIVDGMVLVVAANDGVAHGAVRGLEVADQYGVPGVAVVHQADRPHDFQSVLAGLEGTTDRRVLPLQLPFHDDDGVFAGVIDLMGRRVLRYDPDGTGAFSPEPVPRRYAESVALGRERIIEAVALQDDALLEAYLEYLELPEDDVTSGLATSVKEGRILPVLLTSAWQVVGATPLLEALVDLLPAPAERGRPGLPDDDAFCASVLHTSIDPDGRPYTLLRVWTGEGGRGGDWTSNESGRLSKIRKLFQIRGPRRARAHTTGAGAIVGTWDTVHARPGELLSVGETVSVPRAPLAPVMARRVIAPRGEAARQALERALPVLLRMDHALDLETDPIDGRAVLAGRTPGQLERAGRWLRQRMGCDVELERPRVAYREAPLQAHDAVEGIHEQASPAGLVEAFGRCALAVEPASDFDDVAFEADCDEDELPRRFHGAIAEGAREAAREGPLGGYPVIGARVTCIDGAYDILVSTDEHFRLAGAAAMRAALEATGTRLMEPWSRVTVHAPADHVGAVLQDLTGHRGRIADVQVGDEARVQAVIPERETHQLAGRLAAVTGARGWFEARHSHYDALPDALVPEALREAPSPANRGPVLSHVGK